MVQQIQTKQKPQSRSSEIGAALSAGLGSILSQYDQKQKADQENQAAKQLGIDLRGIQDPETRKALLVEKLKGNQIEKEYGLKGSQLEKEYGLKGNQLEKEYGFKNELEKTKQKSKYEEKQKLFNKLMSGENQNQEKENNLTEESFEQSKTPEQTNEKQDLKSLNKKENKNSNKPPHTQQEIDAWSVVDKTIADNWQRQNEEWQKNQHHRENILRKRTQATRNEEIEFHKESKKYDEELLNNSKIAKKTVDSIGDIEKSLKSGNVKPTSMANFFKVFGNVGKVISEAVINGNEAVILSSIPQLLEGWKEVFGVRLSDADLKVLQDKLPSIGKSEEANRSITSLLRKYAEKTILRYEIGSQIKKESKGLRPLGYEDQIETRYDDMTKDIRVVKPNGKIIEIPAYHLSEAIKNHPGLKVADE